MPEVYFLKKHRQSNPHDHGPHDGAEDNQLAQIVVRNKCYKNIRLNIFKFETIQKEIDMGTIELKSDLHKILDKIENEQLLRTIYDFLKQGQTAEEGQIWKTLTEEQKKEVYLSYEESQDNKNLINWEDLKKKF